MNRLKNINTIGELLIVAIFVCSMFAPLYSIAFPATDAHLKNNQNAEPSNNRNNSWRIKAEELRRLLKSL